MIHLSNVLGVVSSGIPNHPKILIKFGCSCALGIPQTLLEMIHFATEPLDFKPSHFEGDIFGMRGYRGFPWVSLAF